MSADREQVRAALADQIVAGIVKAPIDIDIAKLDQDDVRLALFEWYRPETIDARERLNNRAIEMVAAWLEADPRGALMLDEAVKKEEELRGDIAEMNAREMTA